MMTWLYSTLILIVISCNGYRYRYHNHYHYSNNIYSTSSDISISNSKKTSSSLLSSSSLITNTDTTDDIKDTKRYKGHPHNDDSRKKISEANKGKKPWNVGNTIIITYHCHLHYTNIMIHY